MQGKRFRGTSRGMSDYFIKAGYEHGGENLTLEKQPGDYWSPSRIWLNRFDQIAVYRHAAHVIQTQGYTTALDVGCGVGWKTMHVLAPAACVTGVDQESVVTRLRQYYPKGNFVAVNLEQADDSGLGRFDLALTANVIEHMANPDRLLDFLRQHVRKNGRVIVGTPERDLRRGRSNNRPTKAYNIREWNREELARYLDDRGFEIETHDIVPGFRFGGSWKMLRERWRLLRKRVPIRYIQCVTCRVRSSAVA